VEINTLVAQLAPAIGLHLLALNPAEHLASQRITDVYILPPDAKTFEDCDVLLANGNLTADGKPHGVTLPANRVLALTWLPGSDNVGTSDDRTSIRLLLQHLDWYRNHTQNLTRTFSGSAAAIATAQETAQRAGVWQRDIPSPLLAPGDTEEVLA
jgi:hypothetical protein